jgi:acyl-CoA thioester hydrolase
MSEASMTPLLHNPVYRYEFTIPPEALDENGHVNNVQYIQWMQEAAVCHYEAAGATWVVRSHSIEYLRPAFAGERIQVQTWVVDLRRVRSLLCYRFVQVADGKLLVRGETDWVFVDARSGAPRPIPEAVAGVFSVDFSEIAIKNLTQYCQDNHIRNVTPMKMPAHEISKLGKVDFVFGSMVLHHIEPF